MSDRSLQEAWIFNVLGVSIGGSARGPAVTSEEQVFSEAPTDQANLRVQDVIKVLHAVDTMIQLAEGYQDVDSGGQGGHNYTTLRNPVTNWTQRRAVLSDQAVTAQAAGADFVGLHQSFDAAHALLTEINTALVRLNVGTEDAPATSLSAPATRLKAADKCMATLGDGVLKTTLTQLLDTARTHPEDDGTDSDFQQTMDLFWAAAHAAEAEIRATLQIKLDSLASSSNLVGKSMPVNPITNAYISLNDRVMEADKLGADQTKRKLELWAAALADTATAASDAISARNVRASVESTLHMVEAKLGGLPQLHQARAGFVEEIRVKREDLNNGAALTSIGALKSAWQVQLTAAGDLDQRVSEALKRTVSEQALAATVAAFRTTMGAVENLQVPADQALADRRAVLQQDMEFLRRKPQPLDFSDMEVRNWARDNATLALRDATKLKLLDADGDAIEQERRAYDNANDTTRQAAYEAAFEARFKIELKIPANMKVNRLPELYELFARVPEGHVCNGLLKSVQYENKSGSSCYLYKKGQIYLTSLKEPGATTDGPHYGFPGEDAAEQVEYFKVAALHEIGHAVDDHNTIMHDDTVDGLGGWKAETIDGVASAFLPRLQAVAGAAPAEELRNVLRQVLLTGKCDQPVSAEAPFGALLAVWDVVFAAAKEVAAALKAKAPWDHPTEAPDGRCYHQSYPGKWVSYSSAMRAQQKVSGYQWRSPGEWFAELYAWHYLPADEDRRAERAQRLPADAHDFIVA